MLNVVTTHLLFKVTSRATYLGSTDINSDPHLSTTPIHSTPMYPRLVSTKEVARHDSPNDCWLVVDNQVWDVSIFAPDHPGGAESMSYLQRHIHRSMDITTTYIDPHFLR